MRRPVEKFQSNKNPFSINALIPFGILIVVVAFFLATQLSASVSSTGNATGSSPIPINPLNEPPPLKYPVGQFCGCPNFAWVQWYVTNHPRNNSARSFTYATNPVFVSNNCEVTKGGSCTNYCHYRVTSKYIDIISVPCDGA